MKSLNPACKLIGLVVPTLLLAGLHHPAVNLAVFAVCLAALLLSRNAQHQKGKYHAGKRIEEASSHVPDHIFFFQAQPCFHEKVRPVFHDYFLPFPFTSFLLRKFWISKIESSIRAI